MSLQGVNMKNNQYQDPAEERRAKMEDRLKLTPEGSALLEILKLVGDRKALARATGERYDVICNWLARGRISKVGAQKLEKLPFFKRHGYSRERLRPDLKKYQWEER